MNLVTAEHLTKSYTERLLFDDTDFSINEVTKSVSSESTEQGNRPC